MEKFKVELTKEELSMIRKGVLKMQEHYENKENEEKSNKAAELYLKLYDLQFSGTLK